MNWFDIALLVLIGLLVTIGLLKGLVRILVGLVALVAAFMVACVYHRPLAEALSGTELPTGLLCLLTYLAIFLGVMLAGGLAAWLLRRLIKAAMLGWADRLAGGALGLAAAVLASALIVLPVVAYTPDGAGILDRSVLAPYVAAVADLASSVVPADLAGRYRERIERLRRGEIPD